MSTHTNNKNKSTQFRIFEDRPSLVVFNVIPSLSLLDRENLLRFTHKPEKSNSHVNENVSLEATSGAGPPTDRGLIVFRAIHVLRDR
ncbi:hypothetical protein PROFUN_14252 [Planoprotostelium fungivorum]|uniref:Uncharacterized protein n=1 Tax=Planoprotostelium fungivorum TaxID=1890364 RepID=A0A2P6N5P0_9EUKA|nr:hypothetical protein PROFUN_14252 [Planoprotostelium fungivorum]